MKIATESSWRLSLSLRCCCFRRSTAQNLGKSPAVGQAVQGQQQLRLRAGAQRRQLDMQRNLPVIAPVVCRRRIQVSGQPAIHEQYVGAYLPRGFGRHSTHRYFIAQGQQSGSLHQLPIFTNHPASPCCTLREECLMTTALPDFVSEISGMLVTLLPVAALGRSCSRFAIARGRRHQL